MRKVLVVLVVCVALCCGCKSMSTKVAEAVIKVAENEQKLFGNYKEIIKGKSVDEVLPTVEDKAHELALIDANLLLVTELKHLAEQVLEKISEEKKEKKEEEKNN